MTEKNQVDVQIANGIQGVPAAADISRWVDGALDAGRADEGPASVCLRVVDVEEIRFLNEKYRGIDKPTNVLSFAADVVPPQGARILGDVLICMPVVVKEAEQQGKRVEDHFAHMAVHGALHLIGYDHETDTQAQLMEGLEQEVLGRLGIADPYQQQ